MACERSLCDAARSVEGVCLGTSARLCDTDDRVLYAGSGNLKDLREQS